MDFKATKNLVYKSLVNSTDKLYLVDKNGIELIDSTNITASTKLKEFERFDLLNSKVSENENNSITLSGASNQRNELMQSFPISITGNTWFIILISMSNLQSNNSTSNLS